MKSIVVKLPPPGDTLPTPFEVGELVNISPAPEWARLLAGNHSAVVVEEYPTHKGNISIWSSDLFAPISDQENLQLTEREAEKIRKRHLVQVKYNL